MSMATTTAATMNTSDTSTPALTFTSPSYPQPAPTPAPSLRQDQAIFSRPHPAAVSTLDTMLAKGGNLRLVCEDGTIVVLKEILLLASPVLEGALEALELSVGSTAGGRVTAARPVTVTGGAHAGVAAMGLVTQGHATGTASTQLNGKGMGSSSVSSTAQPQHHHGGERSVEAAVGITNVAPAEGLSGVLARALWGQDDAGAKLASSSVGLPDVRGAADGGFNHGLPQLKVGCRRT